MTGWPTYTGDIADWPVYEQRIRDKVGRRHRHVWVHSAAYESLGSWRPVQSLLFCDVPDCEAVKAARDD